MTPEPVPVLLYELRCSPGLWRARSQGEYETSSEIGFLGESVTRELRYLLTALDTLGISACLAANLSTALQTTSLSQTRYKQCAIRHSQ